MPLSVFYPLRTSQIKENHFQTVMNRLYSRLFAWSLPLRECEHFFAGCERVGEMLQSSRGVKSKHSTVMLRGGMHPSRAACDGALGALPALWGYSASSKHFIPVRQHPS